MVILLILEERKGGGEGFGGKGWTHELMIMGTAYWS